MLEFAEVLEQYFLKHGKRDNYIWTINLLGGIHNAMPDRQDGDCLLYTSDAADD